MLECSNYINMCLLSLTLMVAQLDRASNRAECLSQALSSEFRDTVVACSRPRHGSCRIAGMGRVYVRV